MFRKTKTFRLVPHSCLLRFTCALFILLSTTMAAENVLAKANNQFGLELFKIIGKDGGNRLISPFSAHVVLSMAYQGADGKTAENFAEVFHLSDPESTANEYNKIIGQLNKVNTVTLNIANKIYIKEKFKLKPDFKSTMEKKYFSEADEINFADNINAANAINAWVENKTNKKITKLITSDMLNASTRLVLLNAVYFKGNWAKKFDPELTEKKPFYLLNGEEVMVDTMYKSAKFSYKENDDLNCQILELPYVGNELSMVIFLPKERDGIVQLQEKLLNVDFAQQLKGLRQYTVNVELPKFKIESEIPLKEVLEKMGAGNMFSDEANFSKMADEGLQVSDVIQKTFIEVNEEGAEAAAATGLRIMLCSLEIGIPFQADHPFVFTLVHKTADNISIIFIGKMIKP